MWIVAPLLAFVLSVLLHGLAARVPMQLDSVRRFLLVGTLVGGGLLAFSTLSFGYSIQTLALAALYAFLCELYIFCFTLVLSSVSVTMLILLRGGSIPVSTLATRYDPQGMVDL